MNLIPAYLYASLLIGTAASQAAILADYQFSNALTSSNSQPGATPSNFTQNGLTFSYDPSGNWFRATTNSVTNGTEERNDTPSAIDYFAFTLTPDPGGTYNLASLTFQTAFYAEATGTVSVTGSYYVRSSADNYATTLLGPFTEAHQAATTNPTFTNRTVDLSAPLFQNRSTPITFRIYLFDSSAADNRFISIDNVVLNGQIVSVPETCTSILFLSTAMSGMIRRRRCV